MGKKKKKEQALLDASQSNESSIDFESNMHVDGFSHKKSIICEKVVGPSSREGNLSLNASQSIREEDDSSFNDSDDEDLNKSDKTSSAPERTHNLFDKKIETDMHAQPKGQYADLFKDNKNQTLGIQPDEFECSDDIWFCIMKILPKLRKF